MFYYILKSVEENDRYFASNIFQCIFLDADDWIFNSVSVKFVLKSQIDKESALV